MRQDEQVFVLEFSVADTGKQGRGRDGRREGECHLVFFTLFFFEISQMEIYLQTTLVPLLRGSSHDNGVDHDDDGLDIDTLTTYLLSILEEDLIEWEEKREAITDFLLDHYKLKSSQHIVDALLSHWKTIQDDKARVQEQRRLDELERGKGKAKEELAYRERHHTTTLSNINKTLLLLILIDSCMFVSVALFDSS